MHDQAQHRREQHRQRLQGLRWYDRWLLQLEAKVGSVASRFTSSTVQIATSLLIASVGTSASLTIFVMLFTAEDRIADAVEAGAIVTATLLAATTVTSSAVCLATIADRRRFDLDAITYSRNLTLLLSVHRPAMLLALFYMVVGSAHWAAVLVTAGIVAWECYVVQMKSEQRIIDPTNLSRVNNKAKWGAIIQLMCAALVVVYCGAHLTGILLRAGFGVMVRYFFSVHGTVKSVSNKGLHELRDHAPGKGFHPKLFGGGGP